MQFDDICRQEHAKRAAEVALVGNHTIVFVSPPSGQAQALANLVNELSRKNDGTGLAWAWSPCPCGYYRDPARECTCSIRQVSAYRVAYPCPATNIHIECVRPSGDQIIGWLRHGPKVSEPHEVVIARIQKGREGRSLAAIDEGAWTLLRAAADALRLEPEQAKTCLAVARTIAAMAGDSVLRAVHMAEAIQYRPRMEVG